MAVLNQDNNIKLQALTDSETDAITGGYTACKTADGRFATIAHPARYPTLKDAQTTANALNDNTQYYSESPRNFTPIALADGYYALKPTNIGLYDTLEGAVSACETLRDMNSIY